MIELLYLVAFAAASYSLGNFVLNLTNIKLERFGEEALFSQAIGFLIFVYATLLAGLLGLLQSSYFKIVAVVLLIIFYRRLKKVLVHLFKIAAGRSNYKLRFYNLLALCLVVFAILNFIAALAPVHSSDATSYHIALPLIYAEQGSITYIPHMIPSTYPMLTDMLFLDGVLLAGGILSELIAVYIALLATLAIYLFTKRYFSRTTALLAAIIFYTIPILSVFNIRGFVDISTAFFGMVAVFALFKWHETNDSKMLLLGGLMGGAAAATKLSAYHIPAVLYLIVAYSTVVLKREKLKRFVGNSVAYSAGVVVIILPWIARAFFYTGNPLYPLFPKIFGGVFLSETLATFWTESLAFGFGKSILDLILLPWNLTMHITAFGEMLGIGPVFLAFIPLLFLMKKVDGKIKGMLAIAAALLIAWFYTAQSPRYLFLVYALISIATAYIIDRLAVDKLRIAVLGMVLFTLAVNGVIWVGTNNDELKVVAGLIDKEDFLAGKMTNYELLQYANKNLDNANICLYGEIRGYYSQNDYIWCNPAYQGFVDFSEIDSGDELLERLREVGITHLLTEKMTESALESYKEKRLDSGVQMFENGQKAVRELVERNTELVFENSNGKLYKIKYD